MLEQPLLRLIEPLYALEALRDVYVASDDVTPDEMRRATKSWLDTSSSAVMGFPPRMNGRASASHTPATTVPYRAKTRRRRSGGPSRASR